MITKYRQFAWRTIGLYVRLYVLLLTYVLESPSPWWIAGLKASDKFVADPMISVAQHAVVYGLWGVMLSLAATSRPMLAACISVAAAHAIGTEIAQHFVPERSFGWNDIGADWIGLLLGSAVGFLALKWFSSRPSSASVQSLDG